MTMITLEPMIPESWLLAHLPVKSLRRWRQTGELRETEHWAKDGRAVNYTLAGFELMRTELAPGALPEVLQPPNEKASAEPETESFMAEVRGHCVNPKFIRALVKLPGGSVLASVRLLEHAATARRFNIGGRLRVTADARLAGQYCTTEVKA